MGGYTLANYLHISGPIAMVIAGLITSSSSKKYAMSDTAEDYLGKFWEMVHEIPNTILFILIGLELLVVKLNMALFLIGLIAIMIRLIGRAVSVAVPLQILYTKFSVGRKSLKILIWGGIRGGISVALALSLSADMYRDIFVSVTYIIVLFSIIVQGLTLGKVAERSIQ